MMFDVVIVNTDLGVGIKAQAVGHAEGRIPTDLESDSDNNAVVYQ